MTRETNESNQKSKILFSISKFPAINAERAHICFLHAGQLQHRLLCIVGVKTTLWSAGCYVVREKEAREHSALCMAKKRKEEQYIKFVYLTAVFFITYTLIASPASQIFWGHFCAAFISQKFFLLWGSYCMIKMPWSWDAPFAHKWTKSLS